MATDKYRDFVESIARLLKDGEREPGIDDDGEVFELTSDDAVDTLHSLIRNARVLAGYPESQQ